MARFSSPPQRANRGGIAEGIAQFLGLRGVSPQLEISQSLQPTLDVVAARYPFQNYAIPCYSNANVAAVAAENGAAWIVPGPNTVLEVLGFDIWNPAVTSIDFFLFALTIAQQAAIGVGASATFLAGTATNQDITFPERRSSTHNTGSNAGSGVGTGIKIVKVPAANSLRVNLSASFFLWGSRPPAANAAGALGIVCNTVNQQFQVSWDCREWPIP